MDYISFSCQECGKSYRVEQRLAGKRAKCSACSSALIVPSKVEPLTPPPPPAVALKAVDPLSRTSALSYGTLLVISFIFVLSGAINLFADGQGRIPAVACILVGCCISPLGWEPLKSRLGGKWYVGPVRWSLCVVALVIAMAFDPDTASPRHSETQYANAGLATESAVSPATSLPRFEIQGLHIGEEPNKEFIERYCTSGFPSSGEASGMQDIKIRGKRVWVTYKFFNRKLVSVELMFPNVLFPDILEVFQDKLGAPSDISREPVQTRIGATYENAVVTWQTADGPFIVTRCRGSIDYGSAEIHTPMAAKIGEQQKAKGLEELRGKF